MQRRDASRRAATIVLMLGTLLAGLSCSSPTLHAPSQPAFLRLTADDVASIRELAGATGLGVIDHISEPEERQPRGDDYCYVFEPTEVLGPTTTRLRELFVVRRENQHYDGFEPSTWISRGAWKATPKLIYTFEYESFALGDRSLKLQLVGADRVTRDEAALILRAATEAMQPRADGRPPEIPGCASERITGIECPPDISPVVIPAMSLHEGAGHRLAVVSLSTDTLSGHSVVVCLEQGRAVVVGSATWQSSPSTHRCPE